MNLRRTAQALLTALAILGVSVPAYADGSARINGSKSLHMSLLRRLQTTTPAKKSTPVRRGHTKSRRPTPAEAGRAPNFRPSAR